MRGFGGGNNMMAQAQRMQSLLAGLQEKMAQTEFEGSAANGAVTVTITGDSTCRRVHIDPAVVDTDDLGMLEDLLTLAFNNAQKNAKDQYDAMVRKTIPLPPGMKLPF